VNNLASKPCPLSKYLLGSIFHLLLAKGVILLRLQRQYERQSIEGQNASLQVEMGNLAQKSRNG
jgi:hypothetical protein